LQHKTIHGQKSLML